MEKELKLTSRPEFSYCLHPPDNDVIDLYDNQIIDAMGNLSRILLKKRKYIGTCNEIMINCLFQLHNYTNNENNIDTTTTSNTPNCMNNTTANTTTANTTTNNTTAGNTTTGNTTTTNTTSNTTSTTTSSTTSDGISSCSSTVSGGGVCMENIERECTHLNKKRRIEVLPTVCGHCQCQCVKNHTNTATTNTPSHTSSTSHTPIITHTPIKIQSYEGEDGEHVEEGVDSDDKLIVSEHSGGSDCSDSSVGDDSGGNSGGVGDGYSEVSPHSHTSHTHSWMGSVCEWCVCAFVGVCMCV
eukprot:GHVR01069059.1.p1 GENE.GHVR01069059.1~~GHVR01069059.1.p1  ORF type:complete len:298 (-),score=101.53 GHVR01069059.1:100-993(-)